MDEKGSVPEVLVDFQEVTTLLSSQYVLWDAHLSVFVEVIFIGHVRNV